MFRGTIRYKNLAADELGLLLWAIRLDEGCFQTLGMGKPYGYGRMQVTISALREVEPEALYTPAGLCGSLKKSGADAVEGYIRAYHTYASQKLAGQDEERRPIQEQGEILDFFFLKRTIREGREVSYLDLNGKEYQNLSAPLPSVAQMRRSDAEGEEAASSDALAALLAKYGRKF